MKLDKYFDDSTMSVHLRENNIPYAKKGKPGSWDFVALSKSKLKQEDVIDISKEIIDEAEYRDDAFIEIARPGSHIIQLGKFRIVVTRPPFSDGWEVTAVRPVKKLQLKDYDLSEKLKQRIEGQAEGILISGSPGQGKSTFASALAEFYASSGKIVKTVEAPRDLQLNDEITQYSISHGDAEEKYHILLLTRPDYAIYDEMRNIQDFNLFTDLRLAGVGFVGIVHATNPIDSIQRFIGKIDLGVIPQVIDTVIFIKHGTVAKVLSLEMTVKVPAGMTEADLSRPIVVVNDFENGKAEFEIYSYGEQTVVVPVDVSTSVDPVKELASLKMSEELGYKVRVVSANKAELYVPENHKARVIGKGGANIDKLEKRYKMSLDVKSLNESQEENSVSVRYDIHETSKFLIFILSQKYVGGAVDVYVDNHLVLSSKVNKKGELKVNKKNKFGQEIVRSLDAGKEVEVRV